MNKIEKYIIEAGNVGNACNIFSMTKELKSSAETSSLISGTSFKINKIDGIDDANGSYEIVFNMPNGKKVSLKNDSDKIPLAKGVAMGYSKVTFGGLDIKKIRKKPELESILDEIYLDVQETYDKAFPEKDQGIEPLPTQDIKLTPANPKPL